MEHKHLIDRLNSKRIMVFNSVFLFLFNTDQFLDELPYLQSVLSEEEMRRIDKMKSSVQKKRFIVQRGILRLILEEHCHENAKDIKFIYSEYGKPAVCLCGDMKSVFFNIAHSQNFFCIGISYENNVGVDIESKNRRTFFSSSLADNIFSNEEQEILGSVIPAKQPETFLKGWVQKEAVSKAIGKGLCTDLSKISVDLALDAQADYYTLALDKRRRTQDFIIHYGNSHDYHYALAVKAC